MGKILAIVAVYNTGKYTKLLLERFPKNNEFDILIVNDGSTDNTKDYLNKTQFKIITHPKNKGVGGAIKTGIKYAIDNGYKTIAILAGNNKDNPFEISRLLRPIIYENYDYIQGSRFALGGRWDNLPPFRFIMVKIHAVLFSILTGVKCTDCLNGFRAYKLKIFDDKNINIWQDWLDKYEFETYLHYKVLKLGYRFKEVPVSKVYPANWRRIKYTHIRPIIDWYSIMRPLFLLVFRIKK